MKSSQTLIALGKFGMPAGGLAAMGFGLAASLTTLIWATGDLNAGVDPADYARRDAKAQTDLMRLAQRADDGRPRDPNYGGAPPPGYDGVAGAVQDWLARSNRAYQGIIIKGLSQPPEGAAADEIARKIEETKEEAARAAASPATDEAARKAAEAKAAETMVREAAENADAARKAVEAKAAAESAKKAADAKPKAEAGAKVKPVKREPPKTPAPSPEPAEDVAAKAEAQRLANEREEKAQRAAEERRQAEVESRRLEDEKRKAEARIAEERARAAEAERQKAAEAERRAAAEQERSKAAAEAERQKADEAERQAAAENERSKAAAAEQPAADVDRAAAPIPTERRTIRLTTEPIPRPRPTSVMYRPELASPRAVRVAGKLDDAPARRRPRDGTRVKRWVQRDGGGVCRGAGKRIKPPGRYVVASGDNLWDISARHYRLGRLYPRIYRANRRIVSDPDLIYPCQKLRVPRRRV